MQRFEPLKSPLSTRAPAKINLHLRITGKREDGYHLLESLIMPISLMDIVSIESSDTPGIAIDCPGYPDLETEQNLAFRAAENYFKLADISNDGLGIRIHIEKNIPVAAGLGGGSADAAAVFRLLKKWDREPPSDELLMKAMGLLGADVPICHLRECQWVSGIGNVMEGEVKLPVITIVLANPGYGVSTRWVYENTDTTLLTKPAIGGRKAWRYSDLGAVVEVLYNDLETATLNAFHDLDRMKADMLHFGAKGSLMTGSGPTVFGLFDSDDAAVMAISRMASMYDGWQFVRASNFFCEEK